MDEIITDRSESILRVELNRPEKKNAMTSRMYVALADILNAADKEDDTRVVLWVNIALVPEFGSSWSLPARMGYIHAAELVLLGVPFDARRAADLGFVTQVVPDQNLLAKASETARKLAAKPAGALQASKKLLKRSFREQMKTAMKAEDEEFSVRVRSNDAKEAFAAFLEKRAPDFAKTRKSATAAA
jgi:enoyl-CoA hydratase/carnithine racemase